MMPFRQPTWPHMWLVTLCMLVWLFLPVHLWSKLCCYESDLRFERAGVHALDVEPSKTLMWPLVPGC